MRQEAEKKTRENFAKSLCIVYQCLLVRAENALELTAQDAPGRIAQPIYHGAQPIADLSETTCVFVVDEYRAEWTLATNQRRSPTGLAQQDPLRMMAEEYYEAAHPRHYYYGFRHTYYKKASSHWTTRWRVHVMIQRIRKRHTNAAEEKGILYTISL